jgi:hypothetical protein
MLDILVRPVHDPMDGVPSSLVAVARGVAQRYEKAFLLPPGDRSEPHRPVRVASGPTRSNSLARGCSNRPKLEPTVRPDAEVGLIDLGDSF